jgi:hypothetical protein
MESMKKRLGLWLGVIGLAVASFAAGSCDSVDAAFDCQAVCQRYHDCFNTSYDVGACRSSCRTRSANDPNVRGAADTCAACIDDKSCTSGLFTCGASCSSIVP